MSDGEPFVYQCNAQGHLSLPACMTHLVLAVYHSLFLSRLARQQHNTQELSRSLITRHQKSVPSSVTLSVLYGYPAHCAEPLLQL